LADVIVDLIVEIASYTLEDVAILVYNVDWPSREGVSNSNIIARSSRRDIDTSLIDTK